MFRYSSPTGEVTMLALGRVFTCNIILRKHRTNRVRMKEQDK